MNNLQQERFLSNFRYIHCISIHCMKNQVLTQYTTGIYAVQVVELMMAEFPPQQVMPLKTFYKSIFTFNGYGNPSDNTHNHPKLGN